MKRTFKNSAKCGNYPIKEVNTLPSLTVPDQSMSIEEIIARFASGTLPNIMRPVEFSEDLPDLRGLDISELMDMKRQANEDVAYLETELVSRQREAQLSKFSKKNESTTETQQEPPKTP